MLDIRMEDGQRVTLSGRLDASTVGRAREVFESMTGSFVIDLSDLTYISSAGIGILMATFRRLGDAGETLTLENLSPRVEYVFRLAGLDKVFVIR